MCDLEQVTTYLSLRVFHYKMEDNSTCLTAYKKNYCCDDDDGGGGDVVPAPPRDAKSSIHNSH